MPDDKMPPTVDEIRATFEAVRHKIGRMNLCSTRRSTITRSAGVRRGKCRLQVERARW